MTQSLRLHSEVEQRLEGQGSKSIHMETRTDDVIPSLWGWVQVTPHRGSVSCVKTAVKTCFMGCRSGFVFDLSLLLLCSVVFLLSLYCFALIPCVSRFPSSVFRGILPLVLNKCHRSQLSKLIKAHQSHSLHLLLYNHM